MEAASKVSKVWFLIVNLAGCKITSICLGSQVCCQLSLLEGIISFTFHIIFIYEGNAYKLLLISPYKTI